MDQAYKKSQKQIKNLKSLLELNLEAMYKYKEMVLYNMLILQMKGKFWI